MQPRTARPLARLTEGRRDWYRINNLASTGAAEVWVYDEIGWFGVSAQDFVRDLTAIKTDKIDLHISSPGGDVFDGLAIYQALRNHPAQVTTYVDSLAASAASFIAMAGDVRVIAPHAQMMIHEAWGMCIGNAADMAKMQDELDRLSANLAGIYANRAGGDVETWRAAMRSETWYSAEEAVAAGLADRVQEDTKATTPDDATPPQNRWDLSIFAYAGREKAPPPRLPRPVALAPTVESDNDPVEPEPNAPAPVPPAAEPEPNNPEPEEDPVSDLSEICSRLGLDDTADEAAILAALDARLQSTDTPPAQTPEPATEPNPAPAPTPTPEPTPEPAEVSEELRTELARVSAELAAIRAEKAAATKAMVLDGAMKAGKIKPAERKSWETRYDKAPDVITDVLASIAPGTAVPVMASGETTNPDQGVDIDAEWAQVSHLYPAETVKEG